jgi:hypothetical protein
MTRRPCFWPAYMLLLMGILLATAQHIVSFAVPSWPARALRTIPIDALMVNVKTVLAETLELIASYNDRALRDRPHSFARPANVRFRAALVGDSFLEGYCVRAPVSEIVEQT